MLTVHGTVARYIEGREACSVLAKLVAPEAWIVLLKGDPVIIHVLEQVVAAKWLEKSANVGAVVRRDESTIG